MELRRRSCVLFAAAMLVSVGGMVVASTPAHANTVLTTCSESAFRNAVAQGGLITWSLDCPSIVLTKSVTVPSGADVDVEGVNHTIVINAGGSFRHFSISGRLK